MPLTPEDAPRHHPVYSVTQLTRDIKRLLEDAYPFVWVGGEISNLRTPASGHCYFSLKDEACQIAAVLFRGQRLKLRFQLEDGMSVTGFGRIGVYEPRGTYQFIFEHLEPGGVGALQVAFEQLKSRLAEEGLFDERAKKPPPFLPSSISVVTSASGAVIHDILNVVNRRFPNMPVRLVPVKVQGAGAETEIVSALERLNRLGDTGVILLARGGGSLEDLQAFNSEAVARAIFSSTIPVVSAVGHETDTTIADFVADLRAPTPSAAAELLVPSRDDLAAHLSERRRRLHHLLLGLVDRRKKELDALVRRLGDPTRRCQDLQMRVDELNLRMAHSVQRLVKRYGERKVWLEKTLLSNNPIRYLDKSNQQLERWSQRLALYAGRRLERETHRLGELRTRLTALSPEGVLSRGYAIVRTLPGGNVVRNPESLRTEEELGVRVEKGFFTVKVFKK